MLKTAEESCLLIADISGYTGYLTSTELEHAQDVVRDFIGRVAASLEPAFSVVAAEGDAVFVVAPLAGLDGQLVLDVVDACYLDFRRHSRSVVRATTCECNACRQIVGLDLKFVVHAGPVVRSALAGRENVTGPAAIVVHRLLKNDVRTLIGPQAYLLLTEAAVSSLGLDATRLACLPAVEAVEGVGPVRICVIDMEERWQRAEASADLQVERADAGLVIERWLPAHPAVVWDHILDPRKRLAWQTSLTAIDEELPAGRRDAGAKIHCSHGEGNFTEELIEWRPFERLTWLIDIPGYGRLRNTLVFNADGEGTRLEDLAAAPADDAQRPAWPEISDLLRREGEQGYARLAEVLAKRI